MTVVSCKRVKSCVLNTNIFVWAHGRVFVCSCVGGGGGVWSGGGGGFSLL